MKYLLSILFLFFTLSSAFATENSVENNFNLKGGLSYSRVFFRSNYLPRMPSVNDDDDEDDDDSSENHGFGVYSSFGYKWINWELLVGSDILFGKLEDLTFAANNQTIRGDGSFRIFSLSPMIRYYTPYTLINRWNLYVSAGPTWSLHTFIIDNDLNNSNFSNSKRISFQNRGGTLNVGFEEVVPFKSMHPAFIEVGYSYMRSKQIFIVDAADFKDVITLSKSASKDFYGHYFSVRLGITLF